MTTIQVMPDSDTHNDSANPNTNYSGLPFLFTNSTLANLQYAFLKLDIPTLIGTGKKITNCRLNIYHFGGIASPTTVDIVDVTRQDTDPSQLTWNEYKAGNAWTAPGGDFGSIRGTFAYSGGAAGNWHQIDLTAWADSEYQLGNLLVLAILLSPANRQMLFYSKEAGGGLLPFDIYFDIAYEDANNRADLGRFRLGYAALGTGPLRADIVENMTISDQEQIVMNIFLADNIFITENLNGTTYAYFTDTITITEATSYLSDYLAGIKGTITGAVDITPVDWCQMIQESGQQFELNGVIERAYIFTKQTSQKFDIDKIILPGDAVMFTCPDLTVAVGDEVVWDGKIFTVAENINHYWADTVIYVKHALQRVRYTQPVPQVLGLVASENLKGKTTLTWLEVDFPTFDHYEIWESITSGATPDAITGISAPGPTTATIELTAAYSAGKYVVGGTISIQGSGENDGDYIISAYNNNGGLDQIEVTVAAALDVAGTFGNVVNATHFYKKDTTKTNSITIKNLTPLATYYYIVRAIDKYGNAGWWSNEADCGPSTAKPTKVEGLR